MEKKVKLDSTQKIQLAGAAILLLCVFPLPYGFFTIVRVVTTIISCYLAYTYFTQDKKELAIAFAVIAVLFQPFILDIPGFVRMLRKTGYDGVVSLEHERNMKDPFIGIAESIGYFRGVVATTSDRQK